MKKAVPGTAFFAGWLTAGSTIDRIFDDWRAVVIFAAALVVIAVSAAVLSGRQERRRYALCSDTRNHDCDAHDGDQHEHHCKENCVSRIRTYAPGRRNRRSHKEYTGKHGRGCPIR